MPQTLLALLSMIVASLFAFHQQQNLLRMRVNQIETETSLMATSVAIDRLEEIGAMSFDEMTKSAAIDAVGSLTVREGAENAFPQDTPGDDIDDFDGTQITQFRVTVHDTLRFEVDTVVNYVDEVSGLEISSGSKLKKATVSVYSLDFVNPDTLTLSQLYTCGSRCNW